MTSKKIHSKAFRMSHLYKIIDKKGACITFKPNRVQRRLAEKTKKNKRAVILKGRQFGITTYKCLDQLDDAMFLPNQNLVITAHKASKQKEIFRIVKHAYSKLPMAVSEDGEVVWTKPVASYDSVNELIFERNNSRIAVALDSRSTTLHGLHVTELAFRRDAEEMITGTLPAVPDDAPITIETTANWQSGDGKYFYDLWRGAETGENRFHPIFFGWYDHDEYMADPTGLPLHELDHYRKILESKNVSDIDRRLAWYYQTAKDQKGMMMQEYPTYPEEAFLTTGSAVFDMAQLKEIEEIELHYEKVDKIRIYRTPDQAGEVRVGVDTASGWDYSSVVVRDLDYGLVAHWYEKEPPENIFQVLMKLDELWYYGIIGIEINATSGGETISMCKNHHFENFKLYRRKQSVDTKGNRGTKKIGFLTTNVTRNQILDKMERLVRERIVDEFDDREIREMKYFTTIDWKKQASIGEHDDAIMSDAIAMRMCDETSDKAY